jgi:circadian clock protein KaiC
MTKNPDAGGGAGGNDNANARAGTGISGLDSVLGGGLPQGHLFLVEGEPGSGKTTMGLQFLLAGAEKGERTMYVTLSESLFEIGKVAQSHKWSLDKVAIFEYTPKEDSLRPEDQYSAFHPSEVEFTDTTQTILAKVEEIQPKRIVFDSLSEIRLLARDMLRYRRQILALKHFFANRNCTVMLLDDRTTEHNPHQLQSIAHGVIGMERTHREYGVERRRLRVVKLRGSTFREGYHDYTIETGGVTVYPRLVAAHHREREPEGEIPSEIPALNVLFGGGLTRGTSTLILGPSGCGKSTLSMSYAVSAARNGDKVACFAFDETKGSAIRRARQLGMDPEPLIESGLLRIDQVDPAELSPGQFVSRITTCVERDNTRAIVIDSLNGLMNAMPGEALLTIQMHELLMYLNQRGVVTIIVMAQAGLIGAMRDPADLSYLADNVLLLRYFESSGEVRKAVSVLKKRTGAHERTLREFRITDDRVTVGDPLAGFQGVLTGTPSVSGPMQHVTPTGDAP